MRFLCKASTAHLTKAQLELCDSALLLWHDRFVDMCDESAHTDRWSSQEHIDPSCSKPEACLHPLRISLNQFLLTEGVCALHPVHCSATFCSLKTFAGSFGQAYVTVGAFNSQLVLVSASHSNSPLDKSTTWAVRQCTPALAPQVC